MRQTLLACAILGGLFLACRSEAHAALQVCDASPEPVAVAIAALTQSGSGVRAQAEGWWQIDAGTCQIVIDNDLVQGAFYYLYAKGTTITWSGTAARNTRDASFCTNFAGGFNYVDRPNALCAGAGQQLLWFISEPIAGTDWTIDLNAP